MQKRQRVSEYEKKREEKMNRNAEFLKSLGLDTTGPQKPVKSKKVKAKKEVKVPARRSLRLRQIPVQHQALEGNVPSIHNDIAPRKRRLDSGPVEAEELDGSCENGLQELKQRLNSEDIDVQPLKESQLSLQPNDVVKVVPTRTYTTCFHPSSDLLICVGDKEGHVGLWGPTTSAGRKENTICTFRPHLKSAMSVHFDALNPSKVVSCSYDGTVRSLDLDASKDEFIQVFATDPDEDIGLTSLVNSLENNLYIATCDDGYVEFIDPRMKKHPGSIHMHQKKINTISQHPIRKSCFMTASLDRTAKLWDIRRVKYHSNHNSEEISSKPTLCELPHGLSVNSASFSPSGKNLVTVCMDNHLYLYDSSEIVPKKMKTLKHDNQTGRWVTKFTATWDPKCQVGRFVIGSKRQPRCVEVYSVQNTKPLYRLEHELCQSIHSANSFHPTLDIIASANSSDRKKTLYPDVDNYPDSSTWMEYYVELEQSLAVVSKERLIIVHENKQGKMVKKAISNPHFQNAKTAWSPEGHIIAVVGSDNDVPVQLFSLKGILLSTLNLNSIDERWKPEQSVVALTFRQVGSTLYLVLLGSARTLLHLEFVDQVSFQPVVGPKGAFSVAQWHSTVSAMHYNAEKDILGIAGGVVNPSDMVRRARASSLTVWALENDYELQHFTTLIKMPNADDDFDAALGENEEQGFWSRGISWIFDTLKSPIAFLSGYTLLNGPLSDADDDVMEGSVDMLRFSPDASSLAILGKDGSVTIRETDTCDEVMPWFSLDQGVKISQVAWYDTETLFVSCDDGTCRYLRPFEEAPENSVGDCVAIDTKLTAAFVVVTIDSNGIHIKKISPATPENRLCSYLSDAKYDEAMELATQCNELDVKRVHQAAWVNLEITADTIKEHLATIDDSKYFRWALDQCCYRVPKTVDATKALMKHGIMRLNSFDHDEDEEYVNQRRTLLLKYLDRLDTMLILIRSEIEAKEEAASYYNADTFDAFRNAKMVDLASQFARQGRIRALSTLFDRNGYSLLPHRFEILEQLPVVQDPLDYASLLPALPEDNVETSDCCFFHGSPTGIIASFPMRRENKLYDWNEDGKSVQLEEKALTDASLAQRDAASLMEWYMNRVHVIDSSSGLLRNCIKMCQLAIQNLKSGGALNPIRRLHDEIIWFQHLLVRSASMMSMSLMEWIEKSKLDRIKIAVDDASAESVVGELELIFKSSIILVDETEWYDALQQYMISRAAEKLADSDDCVGLKLCEAIVTASNPLQPLDERVIKGGVRLLEIAIGCVYACTNTQNAIDSMWNIFQSLPERDEVEERRNPRFAQLQIAVDEMEAHLGAAELLVKYDVTVSMDIFQQATHEAIHSTESEENRRISELLLRRVCTNFEASKNEHSKAEWQGLLTDLLTIRDHAFSWIEREKVLEMVICCMISSCAYDIAEPILFGRHALVSDKKAKEIILEACRNHLNSASSGSHPDMDAAKACLALVDSETIHESEPFSIEHDLIQAVTLLEAIGSHSVTPLQVRLSANRMEFIDELLSHNSRAFAANDAMSHAIQHDNDAHLLPGGNLLYIGALLGLKSDAEIASILMKAAIAALQCADYDCASKLALDLFSRPESMSTSADMLMSMAIDIVSCRGFRNLIMRKTLCQSALAFGDFKNKVHSEILERLNSWWMRLDCVCRACDALEIEPNWLHLKIPSTTVVEDTHVGYEEEFWLLNELLKRPDLIDVMDALAKAVERCVDDGLRMDSNSEKLVHFYYEKNDLAASLGNLLAIPLFETAENVLQSLQSNESSEKFAVFAEQFYLYEAHRFLAKEDPVLSEFYNQPLAELRSQLDLVDIESFSEQDSIVKCLRQAKILNQAATLSRKSQLLQKSLSGVDVNKFATEETYRRRTIIDLVRTEDTKQVAKAKKLATEHEIELWDILMDHVRYVLCHPPVGTSIDNRSFEWFNELFGENDVLGDTLHIRPYDFAQDLMNNVFEQIPGTSLGCLEFVCRMVLECSKIQHRRKKQDSSNDDVLFLNQQDQVDRVIQHIQCLRKLQVVTPGIDYRSAANLRIQSDLFRINEKVSDETYASTLEAILPHLTQENIRDCVLVFSKMHSWLRRSDLLVAFMNKLVGEGNAETADQVAYCYDVCCFPYLSKLSDAALMEFVGHLVEEIRERTGPEYFYLEKMGELMSLDKLHDVITDVVGILTDRSSSNITSTHSESTDTASRLDNVLQLHKWKSYVGLKATLNHVKIDVPIALPLRSECINNLVEGIQESKCIRLTSICLIAHFIQAIDQSIDLSPLNLAQNVLTKCFESLSKVDVRFNTTWDDVKSKKYPFVVKPCIPLTKLSNTIKTYLSKRSVEAETWLPNDQDLDIPTQAKSLQDTLSGQILNDSELWCKIPLRIRCLVLSKCAEFIDNKDIVDQRLSESSICAVIQQLWPQSSVDPTRWEQHISELLDHSDLSRDQCIALCWMIHQVDTDHVPSWSDQSQMIAAARVQKATATVEPTMEHQYWFPVVCKVAEHGHINLLLQIAQDAAYGYLTLDQIRNVMELMQTCRPSTVINFALLFPFPALHEELVSESTEKTDIRGDLLLLRYPLESLLKFKCYDAIQSIALSKTDPNQLLTSSFPYILCELIILKEYPRACALICCKARVHPTIYNFNTGKLMLESYLSRLQEALRENPSSNWISIMPLCQVAISRLK